MRGSHAPSLRTIVARTLREELGLQRGDHLLCACSGGPDSSAMLHVLAGLRETLGLQLSAHGVDHGLRAEAAGELELARRVAAEAGVAFQLTRVAVAPGSNLQARARAARYEALRAAARVAGAGAIATAHTLDDRAETVLLRLLRGAGARGLGVLPPRAGDLLRPLARARRQDVLRHLARHRVPYASDPSNLDVRYARVRVRLELMPLLEQLSPRIQEHLAALADELAALPLADPLAGLGRRQREQLGRALSRGKSGRVRVDDCKEVLVRLSPEGLVLTQAESERVRRPR